MGQERDRYRVSPGAFSDPSSATSLGNPDVVSVLVGGFAAKVEAIAMAASSGEVPGDSAHAELGAEITRLAGIFSGRNPGYSIIKGYHDFTLGIKLRVDLGPHWHAHRHEFADDPVAVLFDWLAALVIEKWKLADGDDMLMGVMLKPSLQYAVKVLMGAEERMPA